MGLRALFAAFLISTVLESQTGSCYFFEGRAAVGPAWQSLSSYEHFNRTPEAIFAAQIPDTELLEIPFTSFAYAQGMVHGGHRRYCTLSATVGGGVQPRCFTTINFLTPEPGIPFPFVTSRPITVKGNILITDFCAHTQASYKNVSCMPRVGYTFNRQYFSFAVPESIVRYALKNFWQGPYVGIGLALDCSQKTTICVLYNYVFAHLKSHFNLLSLPYDPQTFPIFRKIPDAEKSTRKARARGTIFGLEARYACSPCTHIGTTFNYLQYQNTKNGTVCFAPEPVPGVLSATLNTLIWKQLLWTFFVEGQY